jgi:predicted nuclease with TOPRIM domain
MQLEASQPKSWSSYWDGVFAVKKSKKNDIMRDNAKLEENMKNLLELINNLKKNYDQEAQKFDLTTMAMSPLHDKISHLQTELAILTVFKELRDEKLNASGLNVSEADAAAAAKK